MSINQSIITNLYIIHLYYKIEMNAVKRIAAR